MTSSPSADVLLAGGLALGLAGALLTMLTNRIRLQRRIYWVTWLLASPLMSLSLLDRGWTAVAVGMTACLVASLLYAYLRTSYIKIQGRIHTYTLFRNRPDDAGDVSHSEIGEVIPQDAYGNVLTAPKFWWTLVAIVLAAAFVAVANGPTPVTIGGALLVTAAAASTGYIDGHDAFPIARRQRVQLAVVTVAAVPLLLLPPVCYALAYSAGRRRR